MYSLKCVMTNLQNQHRAKALPESPTNKMTKKIRLVLKLLKKAKFSPSNGSIIDELILMLNPSSTANTQVYFKRQKIKKDWSGLQFFRGTVIDVHFFT